MKSMHLPGLLEGAGAPASQGTVQGYIVEKFGAYSGQALAVAKCESGYRPDAYNPQPVYVNGVPEHAKGVFQIIDSTFAGVSSGNVYNAQDNIDAAWKIFSRDGKSWREWACQP